MIRTAIIGLGRIAWLLEKDPLRYKPCTHAGSLLSINQKRKRPAFEIVALCDSKADRIDDFKRWWQKQNRQSSENMARLGNAIAISTDYKEILRTEVSEEPLDLIIIATHTDSHVPIAMQAIKAGARAIVLEKPIATDLKTARQLYRLAEKNNTAIWVNFERRYHPAYQLVKDYIDNQKLGALRAIRGRVLTWPVASKQAQIGPLLHDAIHWLDLLHWYAGIPQKISTRMFAAQSGAPVEDTAFIQFDYPEFQAQLESGGRRDYFEFAIELDFDQGRILSGNTGHRFFKTQASKRYIKFKELQEINPKLPDQNAWLGLYNEVMRNLNDRKQNAGLLSPASNLHGALQSMIMLDQCYKKFKKSHF